MNVDISPNLPPRSSCTAAAPTGSGSDGGGSSVSSRSMRMIIVSPSMDGGRRAQDTFIAPVTGDARPALARRPIGGPRDTRDVSHPPGDETLPRADLAHPVTQRGVYAIRTPLGARRSQA